MRIGVLREPGDETRVALVPTGVKKLRDLGAEIAVESGLGAASGFQDGDYEAAGARIEKGRQELFSDCRMILRVNQPTLEEVSGLKEGTVHVSFLSPFEEAELVRGLARAGVTCLSMEMIPRITRAQKMDALSSQANLAGYVAVILAANRLPRIFPMMTTAAGTLAPVRALVIGAGVAGLQAIATARRLGARVDAYDTRPVVKEQVKSVGARFLELDLGETAETKGGYAKALTEEQLQRQREALTELCNRYDVLITTAQVFGRKAPRIITAEMVSRMKPGSVIVDLAAVSGGNVEGTKVDEAVETAGVTIIGLSNFPGRVAASASQVYSNNLLSLISEFWDKEKGGFQLDLEDEILDKCVITHAGKVRFKPGGP